jgi:hypothetical protein
MAIITLAEVKNLLRLEDSYTESEAVIFVSNEWHKLANKPNVTIVSVSSSDGYSTSTGVLYTTGQYQTKAHFTGATLVKLTSATATATATSTGGTTCYFNYKYNDYDADISRLIPIVQKDILNYLNNTFEDEQTEYASGTISFISGSSNYIKDTGHALGFSTAGFEKGMDVYIEGTYKNWGVYSISSISAASSRIKFGTTEFIAEKAALNWVELVRVRWPEDLKLAIAQIIWENVEHSKGNNVQSRSLGPSSVTYRELKAGGYSDSIYRALSKYKFSTFR